MVTVKLLLSASGLDVFSIAYALFLAASTIVRVQGYLDCYLELFSGLKDVFFGCDENEN